jgi:hypothetical protein
MKNLKSLGLCLICTFLCAISFAQNKAPLNEPDLNKPKLFTDLPDQIAIDITELKTILTTNTETGKNATVTFADKKLQAFSGKVIAAASKYNNTLQTLSIRSSNFSGATLTLSSFTQPDGTVSYTGRIISFSHGDAYILEKKNNEYVLIKKKFYDIVNE